MKRFCFTLIAALLLFSMPLMAMGMADGGRTYTVKQDGTGDFKTIQEAVNIVQPGQTVEVYSGIYREEVRIPNGGTDEQHRVTLKAHEGDTVIVTGSDPVDSSKWKKDSATGIWKLEIENSFFGSYNPFAEYWQAKIASVPSTKGGKTAPVCGGIYVDGASLNYVADMEALANNQESYFAEVNDSVTILYANTAKDLNKSAVEVSNRKQVVTAEWNQGYITIKGLIVEHGAAPKTTGFAQMGSKSMAGALSTNGGYRWIIEDCEVRYCRGVGMDFGLGARGYMYEMCGPVTPENPDPSPKLYGYHIIRNNFVHNNATNGIMAFRGAYTELYNNILYNNDEFHTALASEGYIKNVNGGYGINIHDNYFYSDHDWDTLAIWYDTEADGSYISKNIFFSNGPDGKGLSGLEFETIQGWVNCNDNIFVNCGFNMLNVSSLNIFNNLFLNGGSAFPGSPTPAQAYGWCGYTRAMRAKVPGTLETICLDGNDGNSSFEVYCRFNNLKNNIFFGLGVTSSDRALECSDEEYNGKFYEWLNTVDAVTDRTDAQTAADRLKADTWVAVDPAYEKDGSFCYGNECDYNIYYGGAEKINYQYGQARGYEADKNSIVSQNASYKVEGDLTHFKLTLNLDNAVSEINAPAVNAASLGNPAVYTYLGYDFPAQTDGLDFFGTRRERTTIVGPFATIESGKYTKDINGVNVEVSFN